MKEFGGKSDETVRRATGKGWDEWTNLLDKAGMQEVAHKGIVDWLNEAGYVGESNKPLTPWWAQSIVVGYEYYLGRRVKGETADAGFQVGVRKTLPGPTEMVWELLTSPRGLAIWIGESKEPIALEKGVSFMVDSGTTGEIRSVYPGQKLRLQLRESGSDRPTTLQLSLEPSPSDPSRSSLGFHQEHLRDAPHRSKMKAHWHVVLSELEKAMDVR